MSAGPARAVVTVLGLLFLVGTAFLLLLTIERAFNHVWKVSEPRPLWRRLQPLTRRYLPVRTARQALLAGAIWGWLPCGLVYSVLTMTLLTGSAVRGALTTLAFGLGTLPNLMLAGLVLARFRAFAQATAARVVAGLVVLGFGLWGLFHAAGLGGQIWRGIAPT